MNESEIKMITTEAVKNYMALTGQMRKVRKKVSVNYYLRYLAEKDPETGRILHGYGRASIMEAIKEGRVKTEKGLIIVESLKNL
jgi:hypothetical protein